MSKFEGMFTQYRALNLVPPTGSTRVVLNFYHHFFPLETTFITKKNKARAMEGVGKGGYVLLMMP